MEPTTVLENDNLTCDSVSTEWIHTVLPGLLYAMCAVAIALNVLVLLVFLVHKKPCSTTEIYLSNMAAADLFLCALLPFWAKNVSNGYAWMFGEPLCKMVSLFITLNYNCSIYFLVLVCVDRFMALVHPLSFCKLRRRKYAKLSCAAAWSVGLLLNVPILVCRKTVPSDRYPGLFTCDWTCSTNAYVAHGLVLTALSFLIPIVILSFCTVKILRALRERPKEGVSDPKSERKVTVLVLAVLVAFLVCWFPHRVQKVFELALTLELFEISCEVSTVNDICQQLFLYLGFFNSCLNPVLYVMVARAFRKKIREVLLCDEKMRNPPRSTQSTPFAY